MRLFRQHWPVLGAMMVLWSLLGILLAIGMARTDGHFVYALDDPYIHMAMAKSFSQHGVWGVTRHEFTSSSSSPLWTLLLSVLYRVFGPDEATPFVLNVVFASILLCFVYVVWRRSSLSTPLLLGGLLLLVLCVPLAPLTFCGLEHILHSLLMVAVVYLATSILLDQGGVHGNRTSTRRTLMVLLPLAVSVRYETLFAAVVISLLLLIRHRPGDALLFGSLSILPVAVYGLVSVSQGWQFLPNPIILKSNPVSIASFEGLTNALGFVWDQVYKNPDVPVLVVGAIVLVCLQLWSRRQVWRHGVLPLVIVIPAALIHFSLARLGWFFRYEAYIVAMLISFGVISLYDYARRPPPGSKRKSTAVARYALAAPLLLLVGIMAADRAASAHVMTPTAVKNIYEQQWQMAALVREYYHGYTVAANDIGAITYFADIRCVDMNGLASLEVAKLFKTSSMNQDSIRRLAESRHVRLAIVYDSWFGGGASLPPEWIRVGRWMIQHNVVCGDPVVSFYAVSPDEEQRLEDNLREFSSSLPLDVLQQGSYYR